MIEVTGIIKGKMCEGAVVSAKDLIEEFKLPISDQRIQFELAESQIAINMADGKERYSDTRMYKPFITGSYNGNNYVIRYYKTRVDQGPQKPPKYTPARLVYLNRSHVIDPASNLEEAVIFALHPLCAKSPFRNPRGKYDYTIASPAEDAKAKLRREVLRDDIRRQILQGTDEWVIMIAAGIHLIHRAFAADVLNDAMQSRVALLDFADKNLALMADTIDSPHVRAVGSAAKALEQGLIRIATGSGARQSWYYGEKIGSSEICKIPAGRDAKEILVDYLSVADQRDEFLTRIGKVNRVEVSAPGEEVREIDLDDPSAVIRALKSQGAINIHPGELKVYQVVNGQYDGRAFCKLDSVENWIDQMIEKAQNNKPMMNRLKSLLKNGA